MDLKDKLKYYQPAAVNAQKSEQEADKPENLFSLLGAKPVDPGAADVLKLENLFTYDSFLHNAENVTGEALHLPLLSRGQWIQPIEMQDILIFDLETTGLAGGAGTFPFLVGLGIFEPDGIRVIQYFLPDYGREIIAYLDMITTAGSKKHLLSFNGKSFDYPLLKNRFILNRINDPFASLGHIDLLHFARRLWKNNLVNCSLETIEQEIFLFHRFCDIEGWLIPQAYFDFLRTGQVDAIRRIIQHNQQDIVSLGRLLIHMHRLEKDITLENVSDMELRSLFKLAVKNSDVPAIDLILEQLSFRRITLSAQELLDYSLLLKRQGDWEKALIMWEQLLASGKNILFALEEMAKYHEHNSGHLGEALRLTERALKYIDVMGEINPAERHLEVKAEFSHRLQRIIKKLADVGKKF